MKWVFSPLWVVVDPMKNITIDVWLYGGLARYGGKTSQGSHAHVQLELPTGATLGDVLRELGMNTEERGITFINGKLSAMPGIQRDLNHVLENGDRLAFFHLQSMWPFQYRHGITLTEEMHEEIEKRQNQSLHHTYKK